MSGKSHYFSYRNQKRNTSFVDKPNKSTDNNLCFKCGEKYFKGHMKDCIANGKICYSCVGKNHFSKVCRRFKTHPDPHKISKKNCNKVDSGTESSSESDSTDEQPCSFSINIRSTGRSKRMKYSYRY